MMGRIFKRILCIMIGMIVLCILSITVLFHNEIATVSSIKKISNKRPVYEVNYYGSYSFDKYLRTGAKDIEELEKFWRLNLAHGVLNKLKVNAARHGCSAFFAKTPDGDVILARNLDSSIAIPAVIKTSPKGGYKALSMSDVSHLVDVKYANNTSDNPYNGDLDIKSKTMMLGIPYLVLDGMNEKGLTAALCTGGSESSFMDDRDENKVDIFDHTVLRMILDKAGTVEEAIKLLQQYNVTFFSGFANHYIVADADGNSAVIEYLSGKMQVVYKQGDYQIISNFKLYNNPELQGFGSDRYKAYDDVLSKSKGIISTEDALKLLQKNTISNDEQWSVVYNLTKKTVSLTIYNDYSTVYSYEVK